MSVAALVLDRDLADHVRPAQVPLGLAFVDGLLEGIVGTSSVT